MNRIALPLMIALCALITRINYAAYDIASATLLCIAGRMQRRIDLKFSTWHIRLLTAQQIHPKNSDDWITRSGEVALRVVMVIAFVFICFFIIGDLTTAYESHLIAMFSEAAK